ncbi:MAG: hypothetical protein WA095_01200 [Minisyncoccia bacterium]
MRKQHGENDKTIAALTESLSHDGFSDEGEAWNTLVEYYQTHRRVEKIYVADRPLFPDGRKSWYPL